MERFSPEQRDCYSESEIELKYLPKDHGYRYEMSNCLFEATFEHILEVRNTHLAKIKIDQNCKTHLQILIYGAKMLDESEENPKKILYDVLFCKSRLSKIASTKTNKIKQRTPLLKTNF